MNQKQKQINDLTEIVSEFETQVKMFEDFQVRTQKDMNTLSEKCREYKSKYENAIRKNLTNSVSGFKSNHNSVENLKIERSNLGS